MSSLEQQLVRLKMAWKEEAVKTGTGESGDGKNVLWSLSLSAIFVQILLLTTFPPSEARRSPLLQGGPMATWT